MTTQGLSEQEFTDAKAAILYRLDSSMQSPDKRLAAAVTGEFTGKGYQEAARKRETLEKLTLKEVQPDHKEISFRSRQSDSARHAGKTVTCRKVGSPGSVLPLPAMQGGGSEFHRYELISGAYIKHGLRRRGDLPERGLKNLI